MKNLFDPTAAADILSRFEKLEPDSKALWGKMYVAQMLAHIQVPAQLALGDRQLKKNILGLLFGRIAKKKLLSEKPFPAGLPTDPSFVMKGEYDFHIEKRKALALLNRLVGGGETGLIKQTHPFFGKMTADEWGILTWKHLDHHLRQFGV